MPRKYRDAQIMDDGEDYGPAPLTTEAQEMQLANMAYSLIRKRIANGTASAAETVHCLKYGSRQYMLELEKAKAEYELAQAKIKSLESQISQEKLLQDAIDAMATYSGSKNE